MIIVPANTLAAGGFEVANSCRWDFGSSPEMEKTLSNGDRQKWTISWWMKLGLPPSGRDYNIFKIWTSSTTKLNCRLVDGGAFSINGEISDSVGFNLITNAVYRDPSAWCHFVFAVDTTQGTAANRMKLYVNGSQVTSFATETYPAEDYNCGINVASDVFYWGVAQNSTNFFDGYFAEVVFIDGTQYAASDFGEYDEDSPTIWKPIEAVADLTPGTNGFYLDFKDSSNLGNDAFGGTDLTETNLAATDQTTDTPTNNFNVMLPIMKQASNLTFSEGNLAVAYPSANTWRTIYSSIMPTAGKWYWEVKPTASADRFVGIVGEAGVDNTDDSSLGVPATAYSIKEDGNKYNNNSSASYGVSTTTNDIVGVAMDLDNGTVWFSKNGTWMNSATQAEVAAGTTTNAAYSSITVGATYPYGPAVAGKESAAFSFNFGSPPYAISSGNTDGTYGNFEYAVPSGFKALCTKNLAEYG